MSAIIKGNARQATSVQRVAEGAEVFQRFLRDGSLVGADWKQAAIFQGLGYVINVGAFSTPIVGGGNGTVLDQDQPEFVISVPSGTSIMPIRVEVCCLTPLITADADEAEILVAVDQDTAATTGGQGTAETIYNLNTLKGAGSACTVTSAFTANITAAPALDIELMHKQITADVNGTAANAYFQELRGLYEPIAVPILNGPCALMGYWGGTSAVSGFAVVQWVEFPTSFSTI